MIGRSRPAPGRTVLLVGLAIASHAAFVTRASAQAPPAADVAEHLDAFIRELMTLDVAPGLAVAVVRGDETLFERIDSALDIADDAGRPPVARIVPNALAHRISERVQTLVNRGACAFSAMVGLALVVLDLTATRRTRPSRRAPSSRCRRCGAR